MVRRHLLAALARGVEEGDENAVRRALGRIDWILRGVARRRFERELIDAQLAAGAWAATGDPAAVPHVLRIAALRVHRVPNVDTDDVAAVGRAFAALPALPRPSHVPVVTLVAIFIAAAIAGAAVARSIASPAPPSRSFFRPLPPASAGAFRDGGTPLTDAAIDSVLRVELPQLIVATDRAVNRTDVTDPDRLARHVAARDAAAMAAHGPGLAAAWFALLDALDRWAHLVPADRGWDHAVSELRARARVVSDELAGLGLGYYVDGDVVLAGGLRHAIIYAYRVEHVAFVAAGTRRKRVLGLRRIDRLTLSRALLGMQSTELGDPLLLLDQIDEHVATHLLGLLAEGGNYPLGDARWKRTRVGRELGVVAGAAVRRELFAALGPDVDTARQIGVLAADRAELLDRWREYLELHHLTLRPLDSALLPPGYLASLEPVLPAEQRERMAVLDDEMAALGVPRIAARLHDLVAATVRRHEAQHAFDADRATPLVQPTSLQMVVGPVVDADGVDRRLAKAALTELSGYLSQIASDPVTPHLALWALARSAFDRERWDRPEASVAAVVIDGLARELGVPSVGVVARNGRLDRERLGELALAIAERPSADVRAAAARLWAEMFGERHVMITDVAR